ncbi:nucleoside-diphosphate kinase [Candidatus Berkelbacteria bacterium CG_4_9_14_3_um_filter_39_23]|uniref:nucleoside-diphosphate kinase n=2 Tax=Candidatus Berkelbacteria TaxID=1618330 RepID=A0A2M7CI09_9BACT|nr:MAG: nucleoside-diphosphate kinase [Candidatus Berkelbacteria bacterium CG2_30_39_44]PIR27667.1 MAG: nucleoside-diphosphate kinase [Candidatus Berkelbacteria bacterium CG11_big_fil_rev_8_21_14_0_20_40_23]PIV25284.1 MAG: nucleoside-diphosphate kinase [Candidatus Berkelbacteria bacterium CG03_land_8_20_14_0_80_40_36]PIX30618.1 MAG: nucleoside-diphosphate kinase [Candidatus Berkelbacteria bacterium CG_4_8_14_3_um_filter_39_27]PIZ28857.1 MAG: nucleoside-diphosphate kinase [Candidatus Berkelbacte
MNKHPKQEKTFVMVKPDGVVRGLIGDIIQRIEQRGLKIIALKMEWASHEKIDGHYPKDEKWITRLGEKTASTYEKYGYDLEKELGTADLKKIGQMVRGWLLDFMSQGPVVKIVVEGVHAVDMARKICGATLPSMADMGTIRGDYSVDSPALANFEKRAIYNLVHASETPEEATHEISYWFDKKDVRSYDRRDFDFVI